MPKKPPAPMGPHGPRPTPEDVARTSVARLDVSPSGRVVLTFRVTLPRQTAEALVAESVRHEVNVGTLVEQILETAGAKLTKARAS